jgi:hypothetical protein
MVMQQGKELDSLARILVEIGREGGETTSVKVGGLAVTSIVRRIDLESGEIMTV